MHDPPFLFLCYARKALKVRRPATHGMKRATVHVHVIEPCSTCTVALSMTYNGH